MTAQLLHAKRYRIHPRQKVRLNDWDPDDTSAFDGKKADSLKDSEKLTKKLEELQEVLFAEHKHRVLIVLQGMDTAGKDGTIRRVFEGVNPQGVRVAHFRVPTPQELDHDFLWRAHSQVPANGEIVIFNRSHYEDVIVARVHKLAPQKVIQGRYKLINDFERSLFETGTTILKFYLHIDADEQKKRLQERLDDPTKHWKFTDADLPERRFWSKYMKAYEIALGETSTDWAPWYIVPSNHPWFRDLMVSSILVRTLEQMKMRYPPLPFSRKSIVVK